MLHAFIFVLVVTSRLVAVDSLNIPQSDFAESASALADLRSGAASAVLIRNAPIGIVPPTPNLPHSDKPENAMPAQAIDTLKWIGEQLGFAYGYMETKYQTLYRHIMPAYAEQNKQSAESSTNTLDAHCENLGTPAPPHYLCLLCLRGDPKGDALTLLSSADDMWKVLTPANKRILMQKRFGLSVEDSFNFERDATPFPTPISLARTVNGTRQITYDSLFVSPWSSTDVEAEAAQAALNHAMNSVQVGVALTDGDVLCIDNTRMVHGRSPFYPEFDGNDRWLVRALVIDPNREPASPFKALRSQPIRLVDPSAQHKIVATDNQAQRQLLAIDPIDRKEAEESCEE